jgi:hypothetical protein
MPAASASPASPNPTVPSATDASGDRTRLAARTLGDAVLLGVVGDALLRAPSWGANMTVWSLAIVLAMLTLARRRPTAVAPDAYWLAIPAVAIGLAFLLRDSESLTVYNVLALIGTLGLLAAAVESGREEPFLRRRVRDLVADVVTVGVSTAFGMVPLVVSDVSLRQVAGARGTHRVITAFRAALIAIPLLLVFGSLFASADPVFARILGDILRIDAGAVASHVAVSGIIAWLVGGLLRATVLSQGRTGWRVPFPDGAFGLAEVATALGSLVVLFALFVAVQLRYFFGGSALVQATAHMSYADYARRGFFELVTVAALVLPVLLLSSALLRRDDARADRVYRWLAGALLSLLGVIMYSGLARMRLYQSVYGLSEDRVYATVFMVWLAAVFVWFAVTVLRGNGRSFAGGVLISGWGTLIALNLADPAGFVARFDIARSAHGKEVDLPYLATLGADAAPALTRYLVEQPLTAPAGWVVPTTDGTTGRTTAPGAPAQAPEASVATRSDDFTQRCTVARRLLRDWGPESSRDWRSWGVARARARRVVTANQAALRQLAGAEQVGGRLMGCAQPPRQTAATPESPPSPR